MYRIVRRAGRGLIVWSSRPYDRIEEHTIRASSAHGLAGFHDLGWPTRLLPITSSAGPQDYNKAPIPSHGMSAGSGLHPLATALPYVGAGSEEFHWPLYYLLLLLPASAGL